MIHASFGGIIKSSPLISVKGSASPQKLKMKAYIYKKMYMTLCYFHWHHCPVLHAFLWKAKRARCFHILLFSKTGNVLLRSTPTSALRTSLSRLVRVCFANAKKAECPHTLLFN